MNRKLFNKIAVIGVTATAFLATVLTSNNISLTLHASSHGSTCQWNHYEEINPTYKTHGVKEYWICCDHHELGPVFEQPKTGGTITNATHPSNFKDEITSEDARYIAPYTETITFSDGYIPAILTPNSNVSELIVNSTFELQMTVKNGSFGLFLSKHYLDEVFSDPEVVEIQFEAKSNVTTNNFRRKYYDPNKAQWTNRTYEANLTGYGITTTYKTFAYKREYYNLYKEGETFIVGGNVSLGDYIIVDNIRPSKTQYNLQTFEERSMETARSSIYLLCYHQVPQ